MSFFKGWLKTNLATDKYHVARLRLGVYRNRQARPGQLTALLQLITSRQAHYEFDVWRRHRLIVNCSQGGYHLHAKAHALSKLEVSSYFTNR